MSLIQLSNVYKVFSGEVLLRDISFNINEKDKIGIIGINGSGKSTLLKILLGLEDDDLNPSNNKSGSIFKKQNLKIGYLSQDSKLNDENTAFEELMDLYNLKEEYVKLQSISNQNNIDQESLIVAIESYENKDGYKIENDIKQVLHGLGIKENLWYKKVNMLSGGQKTIIALAKTLLQEPELLILDEPTNHLDLSAIEWLEKFLQGYKKALIIISHDTYFLDNTINSIFEIENKTLKKYKGNYSDYVIQKNIYLSGALKSYKKEQERIEKLEEFVRKYKAGQKSKQARGRQKMLDNMEQSENPVIPIRKMKLKFNVESPSVNQVLKIENLEKSYGDNLLFKNLNMDILKGNRVGLIGKNGVGKSTILKIIQGLEQADTGKITLGDKLKIGYYDQNHKGLDGSNNILEELTNNFNIKEEEARTIAGSFLFTKDDTLKSIKTLSGGEKGRVALIKLILSKPNFLIMDEPTNHLDIYSKEILEDALSNYDGTILLVSHDRHFLESIVDNIYLVSKSGAVLFKGNYSEYVLQRDIEEKDKKPKIEKKIQDNPKENKINLSYDEIKKIKNKITKLEKQVKEHSYQIEVLQKKEDDFYKKLNQSQDDSNLTKIQNEIDTIYFAIEDIKNELAITNDKIQLLKEEL